MAISATSGLVSNIDYQSLITQLLSIKRQSIQQLSREKSTLESANSAYSTLNSKVLDLKTAADALRTSAGFSVFTATSSDTLLLSATASSSASSGTFNIVVSALAKAHKIAANGVASDTSTVAAGAGSFKFKVGSGTEQSVSVDATTTLTGLKDSVNALKAGVTASIVNDGSSPNPYRLILTSDSTGTSNAVSITQNDTSLNFATTLQAAQDASFSVDGLSMTRSSNTVSDAITGVSINLISADPLKTTTLTVARDTSAIKSKISDFVSKYNSVVSQIKSNNRYDTTTKTSGAFFGDPVARSIWDDLRRTMTGAVSGLPDTMNRLIHAGISSDTDGVMSVDDSKLSSALSTNFNDVVNLFIEGTTTSGFGKLVYDMANNISDYADGRIKSKQNGLTKNISSIQMDITNKETGLAEYETQLRVQFTALESLLTSLKAQNNYLSSLG
ncbi:MAG: flagellar filament capping protein FliD [Deltaproteobacteria bacterium]|nr:flagellar filament capping protein FliD [Deltaproteobacteria bacterium]